MKPFIEKLEEKIKRIANVIELAKAGKVHLSTDDTPTPQEQCYLDHAGQCGDCSISGGWTGC